MKGIYSDCIKSLKESNLYDSFIWIAEASCQKYSELNWITVHPMSMSEAVQILKEHTPKSSNELLKINLQCLARKGLLKYSDYNVEYIDNFVDDLHSENTNKYLENLCEFENSITDDSKIELSQKAQISGLELYREILDDLQTEQITSQLENSFQEVIDQSVQEYKSYVEETKSSLEKRVNDIENSTIKSIEIISVFAAIIALLIVNMSSIATFAEKGLGVILLINTSTIVCIFFLLLFTKVIVCGKNDWKEILKWIFLILIFIAAMLFLIA